MNKIILSGRMCADPEELLTNTGTVIAKFRIAVDRSRKGPDGEKATDFFNVKAFGKTAEFVIKYLGKGRRVAVAGRHETDEYTTKDGDKKTYSQVNADEVEALDSPSADQRTDNDFGDNDKPAGQRQERPQQSRERPAAQAPRTQAFGGGDEGPDPFADDE